MFKMSSSYWSCLLEKKNVSASRVIPISLRGRALILAKTCVMTVTGGGGGGGKGGGGFPEVSG